MNSKTKLPNPFDDEYLSNPVFQEMYPYYLQFSKQNQAWEQKSFWFNDSMHHPKVNLPFETIIAEAIRIALGQNNTRIFLMPSAYGIEQRILGGHMYFSAILETDKAVIEERAKEFAIRSGYYYQNWNKAYSNWRKKTKKLIEFTQSLTFEPLPAIENVEVVTNYLGVSSGFKIMTNYQALTRNMFLAWQYHFEMLNIGYAACLNFINYCKSKFHHITDNEISLMVNGIDSILYYPYELLGELADKAKNLAVERHIIDNNYEKGILALKSTFEGIEWLKAFDKAKHPWFFISKGNGFYHDDGCWMDDLSFPWKLIQQRISGKTNELSHDYVKLKKARTSITSRYLKLIYDDEEKLKFKKYLLLARKVSVYLEDHNFYIENWFHSNFWQKTRQLANVFKTYNFITEPNDFYYLNRWEVEQALYEIVATWATNAPPRGPTYWEEKITARKKLITKLRTITPKAAVGEITAQINEPLTNVLFGIDKNTIASWDNVSMKDQSMMNGIPASGGIVTGKVIVITDISQMEDKAASTDILVCPTLPPSWILYLKNFKGVVTGIGGMMSHSAIMCREFNIPAIVGVPNITSILSTGDTITIDGALGTIIVEQKL